MKTIRATEVRMEVTLTIEYPEDAKPLNTFALADWVQDQLNNTFVTLPFDRDSRKLLDSLVIVSDNGKIIDYAE